MSTGIFDLNLRQARSLGLALVCFLSLSACVGGEGFSFASKKSVEGTPSGVVVPKSASTTLARGAVKLNAPKGYCIDESSVSNGLQGSSALLAKCSSLEGKGAGSDTAVISVQVSPRRGDAAATPTPQDLVRAVAPNKILQSKQKGALSLVQVATGGDDVFKPADPTHWRGATALDTRLIMFGLFVPKGSALKGNAGADLLTAFARGVSATKGNLLSFSRSKTNAEDAKPKNTQLKGAQKPDAPDTVESDKKGGKGLIARLLNRS